MCDNNPSQDRHRFAPRDRPAGHSSGTEADQAQRHPCGDIPTRKVAPTDTDPCDRDRWVREGDSPELAEALRDLAGAIEEADENGFDRPPHAALDTARSVLRKVHGVSPRIYFVYPMPEGDIAVDAPGKVGQSVILFCDASGRVTCCVNRQGNWQSKEYPDVDSLPDPFLRKILADMEDDRWREKG